MKNRKKNEGKRALCAMLTAALVLSAMTAGGIGIGGAVPDEVTRSIEPDSVAPGEDVTVTIAFTTPEDLYYLWLRDHVPLGWDVTDMEVNEGPQPFTTKYLTLETMGKVIFAWVDIGAGTQIEVQYTLHVPADAEERAYTLAGDIGTGIGEVIATIPEGTVTVKVEPPYDVNLDVDEGEKTTDADVNATYYITVENTGTNGDTYDLSVTSTEADFAWLNKTSVSLGAGESEVLELNVSSFLAGDYDTTVEASSTTQPGVSDDVTVTTTVNPYYEVDLGVSPEVQTVEPDENAAYTLTVTNIGNTEDTFNLVPEIPGGVSAQLNKAATNSLGHGESDTVLLNVSSTIVGEYTVNVTATSQGNPSVSDTITTTTNVSVVPRPDLIVTGITPNCGGYIFANESNTVNATIKNNGTADAGAFNVSLVIDGFSEEVRVSGLVAGDDTVVCVTDTTSRTAGESVTITVTADCNTEIDESDETNNVTIQEETVVNNGYKGKRYTGGEDITTLQTHTLNGSILYSVGDSNYLSGATGWTTNTSNWAASDLPVPGDASIEKARLYVMYTWDKADVMPDEVSLTFNGNAQARDAFYTDRKGYDGYDYPYGMLAYNVTADFDKSGNSAVLTNSHAGGGNVSIRGMLLVVIYADESEPQRKIIMNEGFDLLYGGSDKCTTPEEATAYAPFAGAIGDIGNKSARLITAAPGAGPNEGELIFNGNVWTDVWNFGGATQIGIDDRDVTDYLDTTNEAGFQSSADWMEASNAILVVEAKPLAHNFTIEFVTGSNMIGIPVNDTSVTNASLLATEIGGNCTQISKWDTVTQQYVTYIPGFPLNNFDIVGGEGYYVTMTGPATVIFTGKGWESPFTISLVTGNNMIGIPVNDTSVTNASSLATKIGGNCTQISKWDTVTQQYVTYIPGFPLNDFDIVGGEGYYLTMTGPATVIFEGEAWSD